MKYHSNNFPLLYPALGWVAGLACLRMDIIPLSGAVWVGLLLLSVSLYRPLRLFCLAGLAGLVWGGVALVLDAERVTVDASWLGHTVLVTADIVAVRNQPGRIRLTLGKVERRDGAVLPGQAFLYGYGSRDRVKRWGGLAVGNRIATEVRWHRPQNAANPGGFDYQTYCFDHHIALIGTLKGEIRLLSRQRTWLEKWRQRIRDSLAGLDQGRAGVLRALLLADRSLIPNYVQNTFSATGAAHLLAISGLHIGMVAMWAFVIGWWLFTRREGWIVRFPVRKCCLILALLVAIAYATLAGWPLPTRRAVLLLAGTVLAWWLRAGSRPVNTLSAALFLVLALDPQAVMSVSLWLSFSAAFALLLFAERQGDERQFHFWQWLSGLLKVSILASLATLPLIASRFEIIPLYSLLANILLVPLYTVLILPVALIAGIFSASGLESAAVWLFQVAGFSVDLGNRYLSILYELPAGRLWIPAPPWMAGIFYLFGMSVCGFLFLQGRKRLSVAGVITVLALYLLIVIPERPPSHPLFVAWDVGQGAASSLYLPGGQVFVEDSPGRPAARFNGGTKVASGLRQLGASHIDILIISHAQGDHTGGINRLIDQVRYVGEVWLADVPDNHHNGGVQRLLQRLQASGTRIRWLHRGDQVSGRGYRVSVLWPPQGFAPSNDNNASLVLSVHPGHSGILLPGDIESEAESAIVANGLHRHDLLLIPHHGSTTSSSDAWVEASAPDHAIAQTGRQNRYGFPKAVVVQRYHRQQSRVWNTADGAVLAEAFGTGTVTWKVRNWQPETRQNRDTLLQWWKENL